jgi:hypothetical protein
MKGLELPMNTLIIVIVAVIVLLAVIVLFFGTWTGIWTIDINTAKARACTSFIANGCNMDKIDNKVVKDFPTKGSESSLSDICSQLDIKSNEDCARSCGCNI